MTINDWLTLLRTKPLDRDLWLGFSLWLQDEADDPEAARWANFCAANGVMPDHYPRSNTQDVDEWAWWRHHEDAQRWDDSWVPTEVWNHLGGKFSLRWDPNYCKDYGSYEEAMLAHLEGWKGAVAKGLVPEVQKSEEA